MKNIIVLGLLLGCSSAVRAQLPLHKAVASGDKVTNASGIHIEAVDRHGWTPLLAAVVNNQYEAAELLLRKGAQVAAKNRVGWTALHMAAAHGNRSMVQLLLANRASIHAVNIYNQTAADVAQHAVKELLLNPKSTNTTESTGFFDRFKKLLN